MNIPFNFGIIFLIEVYISGLILSLSLYPLIMQILKLFKSENIFKIEYLFFIALIIGLILDIFYYNIHRILEGRLLWPNYFKKKGEKKWNDYIQKIQKRINKEHENSIEMKRIKFFLDKHFPRDDNNNYLVKTPTRLGNIDYTYSYYPLWRYGLNIVDTFHYIMLNIDKNQIDTIELKKSRARFTVFSSFSFFITFIIYLVLAISFFIGIWWAPIKVEPFVPWFIYLFFSILSFVFAFLLYLASCEAHRVYGEFYNAAIDINIEDLKGTYNKIKKYSKDMSNEKCEE